jgi:MscS family membrane protein
MAKTSSTFFAATILFVVLLGVSNVTKAADSNPLKPPDMSSPRATLESFAASMDEAYTAAVGLIGGYAASDRLYMSAEERRRLLDVRAGALRAVRALDTSTIFPVVRDIVGAERAIQLKEILDRIGLPPPDAMPDRNAMTRSSAKRWRIPDTEIDLVQVESGPHAGDYLVSADTIDRIPEFYHRVRNLPYLPGPAKQLSDIYRSLSGNQTATIYEIISNSPAGLDRLIPTRWMISLPPWLKVRIADVAIWQWLGFTFGLFLCALFIFGVYRLARRLARRREDKPGPGWDALLTPAAIIIVAYFAVPLLTIILRIASDPRVVVAFAQTIAVFATAAWASVIGASILGDAIARSEHLTRSSLDSQLIRLATRFVGILIAVGLLMQAATELGFPAYSVLAGLGVGGLAIALAARDSLANFLGSVLIMFEKPFRVGHMIRVSGSDGTVEQVGFRSTRIRTADNSLISIPNNVVVNATVENLSLRAMRRQRLVVQVTYDTPAEKMEALSLGIEQILTDHPNTKKDNFHVRFNEFGDSSLNILVVFHLDVTSYGEEIKEREKILYDIMALAKELGVEFAFPTRTLHVEAMPATVSSSPAEAAVVGAAAMDGEPRGARTTSAPVLEKSAQQPG